MSIRNILITALLAVSVQGFAQEPVEVFGYYEPTYMGAFTSNESYQLFTNKLRIDLNSNIADNVQFRANFDYITYHGKTQWNILEFLSAEIRNSIPVELQNMYTIPFENRQFLDNAYIRVSLKGCDVYAGKQQISLGSGYVWNPLDVFNTKDPLDPTYEQPGHNALRIDVPLGSGYTVSGLYSPDASWKYSAKMVRLKGRISHFDYSLAAIETAWCFHDYTVFDPETMYFTGNHETRIVLGGSLAGEILGFGVWAEYGYNRMEQSPDFTETVIGADYTFDCQTYVMAEYYRNTLGKTDYREYTITDWMRQFAAEQKTLCRDQVYSLVQHPVTDLINVGISSIYSVSDQSLAIIPTLTYSFTQNMDITAYININTGRQGTAYAYESGSGGLIRARVYF